MSNCKEIIICWIPSHIRLRGNERADAVAKSALDLTPNNFRIPYTDLKPKINKLLNAKWQQRWNINIHNKLSDPAHFGRMEMNPLKIKMRTSHNNPIAHWSYKAHSFRLKQEQQQCLTYKSPCTVKHILRECRALALIGKRFLKVNSLMDLFKNVKIEDVLSFLRETGIYLKIWWIEIIQFSANKWDPAYLKRYLQSVI